MRIAVNTQALVENGLEGLGWFTFEVLKRIVVAHPEHQFIFIFSRPCTDTLLFAPNVEPVVLGPKYGHPLVWLGRYDIFMPIVLKKVKADMYFM